ncbi:MAG TPA: ATP-binding protein, partial [Polyangiaceae bacterium]|nr:ATP-binding protein [Polyangiaceae bacterium]
IAHSEEEAIEMLSVRPLDCILLNGDMPGGRDTCRRIKESATARTVPIILMTAVDKPAATLDGFGAGADDCIGKSSDLGVLTARIRAQMRRKQIEDEYRSIREDRIRAEERAARQLVEEKAMLVLELERKNNELEAFSYSLSHDLRGPLRAIDGFSHVLLEDYADRLDDDGRRLLQRVRAGAQRMGELIDDMLQLSRVGRADLRRTAVDMSRLGREIVEELERTEPSRRVRFTVAEPLMVEADRGLLRILLENLLSNAWKFTSKVPAPTIELGEERRNGTIAYFVRDNGAGFDMAHADKLFRPFQRLHPEADFPGTGIGLATVHRIVERHGGRVWADGTKDAGAAFFFTMPRRPDAEARPR